MNKKDNEKKKEYLCQYLECKKAAKRIEDQIEELRTSKMCPSGVLITDMPTSHNTSDLSSYIAKYYELIDQMKQERYKAITTYTEIFKRIEMLENETEKQVLTLRYIKSMKWENIACQLGYEWTWIHKIHSNALEHFEI